MKATVSTVCLCAIALIASAQVPQGINFQSVVRDPTGQPMRQQQLSATLAITTSPGGAPIFRETHAATTDEVGQVKLIIGSGTPTTGSFANIPWSNGFFYLEGSFTVGSNIISIAPQLLNTVPFAFYANRAGSLAGPNDVDNENELIESVTLNNSVLHVVENGVDHSVNLSTLKNDDDANPTNEFQNLTLNGNVLSLSNSESSVNLSSLNTDSQLLSFNGTNLTISNGNAVDLSALEDDGDSNPSNELQTLSVSGSTLNISGVTSPINLGPYLGTNTDEQTLGLTGTTLSISNGNNVNLSSLTGATTLQQAYAGGSTIQLNGTTEFRVNTSTASPLLATDNINGRIGIGTNSPSTLLEVKSAGPGIAPNLSLSNSDNTHMMSLFAGRVGDPNPFIAISPTDPLRFAHYDGVAFTERMRISSSGNFGLGTSNPQHKLHLIGNTSPATQPELPNSEAAFVLEATESNTASLLNIGLVSLMQGSAQTNYAIVGNTEHAAPNNRGVYGYAAGATLDNIGVYGFANGAATENVGVRGFAGGATTNRGIIGNNTSAGTTNYGGYFRGRLGTANNYGVYAEATEAGTNNYGIYASASGATNNYAGHFVGQVSITGNTSVGGTSTFTGNATFEGNASITGTLSVTNTATFSGNTSFASGHSFQSAMLRKGGAQLIDIRHSGIYAGNNAGNANTGVAFRNIGIGPNALASQTNGADNLAIGESALQTPTDLTWNIALGSFAMSNATGSLSANVAIGSEALQNLSGSSSNIAVGLRAMEDFVSGNHNVAIGQNAMDGPGGGSHNVALGGGVAASLSTGSHNVVVGWQAGGAITTESNNVLVGGFANTSAGATNAIAIGNNATVGASNSIVIGANATTSQTDAIILGNSSQGNVKVGIGTNTPGAKLHVVGDGRVDGLLTVTTLFETSDRRLKTDIQPLINALTTLNSINGVSYHWIADKDQSQQHGLIAQEVEKVLPEIVKTDANGFKSVNYIALIPFLLEAIKEQQRKIDELKDVKVRQESFEAALQSLTAQIAVMKSSAEATTKQTDK